MLFRALMVGVVAVAVASSCSHDTQTEMGAQGPQGPPGPKGDKGDMGDPGAVTVLDGGTIQGPPGPQGPAGASVQVDPLAVGDASCPQGGVRLTAGGMVTIVCNGSQGALGPVGPQGPAGVPGAAGPQGAVGPPGTVGAQGPAGPQGPAGASGPQGPAGSTTTIGSLPPGSAPCPYGGTQLTTGTTTTYACNGGPVNSGNLTLSGGIPPVSFLGYTASSYGGNLGGRSGAHALCNAAFAGSHFCTDWEIDQATPPPVSMSAWVDLGNQQTNTRYFRVGYSTNDFNTCGGWTSSSATMRGTGGTLFSGQVFTTLGGVTTSFVATGDGGCENVRVLACCRGGTAVRFRGFTPATMGGNLGGRTGAHALCGAAFTGSHFCSNWEVDQAAVPAPIPSSGAWIDMGNADTTLRRLRPFYSSDDFNTCAGWTTSSASFRTASGTIASGSILTALGGADVSFIATNDGGCETARPVACCDGYPPL